MQILCLGTSYTACYGAVNFCKDHNFTFLSRSPGSKQNLNYFSPKAKPAIDCIWDTVPPARSKALTVPYAAIVGKLMEQKKDLPYIYVSSTAVFPSVSEQGGAIKSYDENSSPAPEDERGERRLRMEELITKSYPHARIIRSTGIYGPRRSLLSQFLSGNFARLSLGNRIISRIHVQDLVRLALALSQKKEELPALVCGVDARPAPYSEVFSFLEQELGIPIQGAAAIAKQPIQGRIIRSLYVSELLGAYDFPTYKEGFGALYREEKARRLALLK